MEYIYFTDAAEYDPKCLFEEHWFSEKRKTINKAHMVTRGKMKGEKCACVPETDSKHLL